MHTTIYSISESPQQAGLIWVGTDDGNLQVTRDGGKTGTNVIANVPGMPKDSWVNWVQASRFDAGTAYVAFDRHTFGDMAPYVYKTTDYGKTWTRLVSARDAKGVRGYAHVIKEDSVDARTCCSSAPSSACGSRSMAARTGRSSRAASFPPWRCAIIAVQARENGPGAGHPRPWHLDHRRHHAAARADRRGAVQRGRVPPGAARRAAHRGQRRLGDGDAAFVGANPPDGAVITYYQRTRHLFGKLKIDMLDRKGKVIDDGAGEHSPGDQPGGLDHAPAPAAVPPAAQLGAGRNAGPARAARCLHGAHGKGRQVLRDEAHRRSRSPR